MWPRAHLDVLADSRNLDCPNAKPETITDALKSATLVLPFNLELCAFEAVASGHKTGSCLPRGGARRSVLHSSGHRLAWSSRPRRR
jgi:hypothetical protein